MRRFDGLRAESIESTRPLMPCGDGEPIIGDLEQQVLLAILRLGTKASGVPIVEELRRRSHYSVRSPSVYVALRRLESKGLIRSKLGEPRAHRGGRARRFFRLEPDGATALRRARDMALSRWRGVSLDHLEVQVVEGLSAGVRSRAVHE
jgi:PadR family transcriptional regulator PadR